MYVYDVGQLSFSVRVTPDQVNKAYDCRVCLNLGFYQHAYISLALLVTGEYRTWLITYMCMYECTQVYT